MGIVIDGVSTNVFTKEIVAKAIPTIRTASHERCIALLVHRMAKLTFPRPENFIWYRITKRSMVCPVCITPPFCCVAYTAIQATTASDAANDIVLIGMKEKMSEVTTKLKAKRIGRSRCETVSKI